MKHLALVILACAFLGTDPAQASRSTDQVVIVSDRSIAEMGEYVDTVDRRLQKGRYDDIDSKERVWIIEQIASMREALKVAGDSPSEELKLLAGEFELGMIKIEEGGIVCRREQRTGSRTSREQKCYSHKRLQEDSVRSRENVRRSMKQWPIVSPNAN